MDFSVTPEQQTLIDVARAFAADRIAPNYRLRDHEAKLHRQTLRELGEHGFFGIELPESVGGLGQSCVTAGLVLEALCADDLNIGYVSVGTSLVGQILHRYGRPQIVEPWIRGMLRGELLSSIALTETGGGSDAASLKLKAVRHGDEYILSGEKTSISMATQADFAVVFARTGSADSRARGVSSFLVPLDDPRIACTAFDDHGGRSVGRGSLFFDEVRVPATHLLGEENKGFSQVMVGFDYSRALLGLLCLAV
ncbi:MAG: acyl-CoA dehydrogenase family protein, partial [Steroidobacteraceae bacterium]